MADENQVPSEWEQNVFANVLMNSIKEQRSARRWGIFFKAAFFIYIIFITLLILFSSGSDKGEYHNKPHTALVNIDGVISPNEEANADAIVGALREAFKAPQSKAVIMRINSPGGSPVQSSYIYNEVVRLKEQYKDKKVYAVIADVGGSGGYFVASAADEIYANEASIVGSIGVLMMGFGFHDAIEKLGVEQRTLTAGENKNFLDPFAPVNPKQQAFMQTLLDSIHQQFIGAVKKGRGDRLKDDPQIYSGLFWTGEQALGLGLIDGFGTASYVARDLVGHEEMVDYSMSQHFFDKLAKKMGVYLNKSLKLQTGDLYPQLVMK